jgi:hypothetical protein
MSRRFQGFRKAACCQQMTGSPISGPMTSPRIVARLSDVQMQVAPQSLIRRRNHKAAAK